jgi:hypothetical protein
MPSAGWHGEDQVSNGSGLSELAPQMSALQHMPRSHTVRVMASCWARLRLPIKRGRAEAPLRCGLGSWCHRAAKSDIADARWRVSSALWGLWVCLRDSSDSLPIRTYALFANYAAVLGATTQFGSDTVIKADATDSVTLTNLTASTLSSNNFHFS